MVPAATLVLSFQWHNCVEFLEWFCDGQEVDDKRIKGERELRIKGERTKRERIIREIIKRERIQRDRIKRESRIKREKKERE